MTSQARILANRRNAQKSTGPRTEQGKTVASQNSVKHGLLASQAVIASEDKAEFDDYRERFLEELSPVTPMESMLADRIITLSWRLSRANRFQSQTIDELDARDKNNPFRQLQHKLFSQFDKTKQAPPESQPERVLGRLAVKDFSNDRILDRLLMYERRIENSLYKTILEYQRLILIRNLDEEPRN